MSKDEALAAATQAEPSQDEILKGLLTEDEPEDEPNPEPAAEENTSDDANKGDDDEDEDGDDAKDEPAAKGEGDEEPEKKPAAEGTPDKAVQKLQQDLATAQRTIAKLSEKAETEGLTQKEKQEVQKQARKLDAIKTKLTGKQFDAIDDSELIGETLLEIDGEVGKTNTRLAALEAELQQLRPLAQKAQADEAFAAEQAKYPGVDVRAYWQKALADAAKLTGEDPRTSAATQNAANKLYERRCAQAVRDAKDRGDDPAAAKNKQQTKPQRATTTVDAASAVNARKSAVTPATELTQDQVYMNLAMGTLAPANK